MPSMMSATKPFSSVPVACRCSFVKLSCTAPTREPQPTWCLNITPLNVQHGNKPLDVLALKAEVDKFHNDPFQDGGADEVDGLLPV